MSDESIIRELQTHELTGESLKYHLLAEAIRRGAAIRPQCFGVVFSDGKSCALGAAYEGLGGDYEIPGTLNMHIYSTVWPTGFDFSKITVLNDQHYWTREAIADRLDDVAYNRIPTF